MNPQELFEFIKNNLTIRIEANDSSDYYSSSTDIVRLVLKNPETGNEETISEESTYISHD